MTPEKLEELALQAAIKALVREGSGLGLSHKDRLVLASIRGAECYSFAQQFKRGYMAAKIKCEEAEDIA